MRKKAQETAEEQPGKQGAIKEERRPPDPTGGDDPLSKCC